MSTKRAHWFAFIAGITLATTGIIAAGKLVRPCPDLLVVAHLVDACMAGAVEECGQLEYSISAKCLMDRVAEASIAKLKPQSERLRTEGITL